MVSDIEDMKKIPSLAVYLAKKGIDEDTPENVIERYKREHRKLYQQAYREQRKSQEVRIEHRVTKGKYQEIVRHAKAHNRTAISPFILDSALAYLEQSYLDPSPKQTKELIQEVRQIGNNINQVVQVMHSIQAYHEADKYQHLKEEVTALVALVKEQLLNPPKVGAYITEVVKEYPPNLANFEALLLGLKQKYGNQEQDTQG